MQTIQDLRTKGSDDIIIPKGYDMHGWSTVFSHEMNVLFKAVCYAVSKLNTKEEMLESIFSTKALDGTFDTLDKNKFNDEENYENYVALLEKYGNFLKRSNYEYPATAQEALDMFIKWGLVIDKGTSLDVPVDPFPEVVDTFELRDDEMFALYHIRLESLIHPVFSQLVMYLHEKEENEFSLSKNEIKEILGGINDNMLTEVLIKLTPYLEEPIDRFQEIPDNEKMGFKVVWERIYEDFLGTVNPQALQ
ncbi:DUF6042 family protein [Brevibacillus laterosporus]|uniref:DUF6042 family protein n=1 Tax=Brevibacillus laterosporus TaxID=1465 RepID=UPI0018CE26BD|nr:DUF6042 family protein [Brevibacillus laterosporus]MBG9800563.1 hypothetical protein [Brevibacillus laterosporus]MCR8938847.1 DUF6042 family protein [Brevibacillus laterosporus]MCZ0841487.1 DUF6042 family protein [Brevibacillus laterosporus]MCZ0843855.1 DUF6042 family protein [Brevibacillus laterosporus]MED1911581.1 DUF6042 family protein [Brevibacillus laterosporus]